MAEEAIFSFVLETLGKLVSQEAEFLLGVNDQVKTLQRRLKQMHWFLRDADGNQDRGKRVLEWVLQARDLAYESEDLIETYAFKIASRHGGGVVGRIKRYACLLSEVFLRHQLGSDIESLMTKILDLTRSLNEYGIISITENKYGIGSQSNSVSGSPLLRRTYSIVAPGDDIFIGVGKDADKLADLLVGDEYAAVGMFGMGGIGKTTLARNVYHHPKVRSHFGGFVWVCISQQWNKIDILQGILMRLMPDEEESIGKWRDEKLVRVLSQALQNRRCLVVLDDIWEVEAWESIKDGFSIGARGSKILITTRNVDVFTQIDVNGFLHEPRLLSIDESWELLCRKGVLRRYGCQDSQEHKRFEELGKDMVTHCAGLPLAVVVLGGILVAKQSYNEWEKVRRNMKSFLGKGKNIGIDQGKISQVLTLSYDELPYKLKPCFLYLSKYSEDEVIEVEKLYQIWMAEGMILAEDRLDDERMMEVAERYLGALAERCMVIVEKEDAPMFLQFKSCRLHDLMRELCLLKAREENFLELVTDVNQQAGDETSLLSRTIIRHSINLSEREDSKTFVPPKNAVNRHMRSFSLVYRNFRYGWETVKTMKVQFSNLVMLRVLCLEGFGPKKNCVASCFGYKNLPNSVSKLVHLRYFSLRNSSFNIPSSISNIKHLHTLDLRSSGDSISISIGIERLEQLKHLYLPGRYYTLNVEVCRSKNLGLQGLRKLEILDNVRSDQFDAKHISALTNLRSLSAWVFETEYLKQFVNQVCNITNLRLLSLQLDECDFSADEELATLREVFSLNCLISLKLFDCRMSRLPAYEQGFCKNLHTLSLVGNKLEEDPFSTLEKFPNLIKLSLRWTFVGQEMTTHADGFPKLQSLNFYELRNLEKWTIEDGAMKHLSLLSIQRCHNLKTVPVGFKFLTSLKELNLYDMTDEIVSRVQVKDHQQGADFGIVSHVPSITINKHITNKL